MPSVLIAIFFTLLAPRTGGSDRGSARVVQVLPPFVDSEMVSLDAFVATSREPSALDAISLQLCIRSVVFGMSATLPVLPLTAGYIRILLTEWAQRR